MVGCGGSSSLINVFDMLSGYQHVYHLIQNLTVEQESSVMSLLVFHPLHSRTKHLWNGLHNHTNSLKL